MSNEKILKFIVKRLCTFVAFEGEKYINLHQNKSSESRSFTLKDFKLYVDSTSVIECVIDTFHLLVQMSWCVNYMVNSVFISLTSYLTLS